ncbi:MAG: 4Fe-4S binding protein [Gammaproteobacteria bacterium]|nr:4Fe-4S binding protein [Gammaproteobacteria bacterium]
MFAAKVIFRKPIGQGSEAVATMPQKWLPRIDRDYCQGCGRCVAVCPARCLALVWSYSTLVRPADCTSCGACVSACPERLIAMTWESAAGPEDIGVWRKPDADGS